MLLAFSHSIKFFPKNITNNQLCKKQAHKIRVFSEIIQNKKASIKLQPLESMKIYNIFHFTLPWKASTNALTHSVDKWLPQFIIYNKEKLKPEDIVYIISYKSKLSYWFNKLTQIKTENDIMQPNLRIHRKLYRNLNLVTLKNS